MNAMSQKELSKFIGTLWKKQKKKEQVNETQ